ncbi:velvet factor-domain-containing protein [Cokeromyces recurvatus]|uniref:velvet factor-domain-containing protein n=1 Tax=Cokeromyces recurvatus TaxID=90255 RepID=UPI002220D0C5|nr:velvet factor-domain-containing protein [Cokeromyces recurvatus]KAI7903676.1 velvet factor-domain-containing protein [Cokeromyces recurvatus]
MNQTFDVAPPLQLARPSQSDIKYKLVVVQNPVRARACGFGEKDRRAIDPPPIVQLISENSKGERVETKTKDSMLFVVQCELYNKEQTETRSVVYTDKSSTKHPNKYRNLIGSTVSNAYHLVNESNEPGIYFVFHDLSVRTEGTFSLKFIFINLAAGEPLTRTTKVQEEVFSEPFLVYSAKKFPGLTESTPLSKCFARQGIKIPIRQDPAYKKIENILHVEERYNDDTAKKHNANKEEKKENNNNEVESSNHQKKKPDYKRISISDFLSPE